jgi:para-nitrobenzyl esterase
MVRLLIVILVIAIGSYVWLGETEPKSERSARFQLATSSGITQGQRLFAGNIEPDSAAVVSWFDIPFAQVPSGDLRWRAPRVLNSPNSIIVEKQDTACVQLASEFGGVHGEGIVGSEDCLYLDIKAPADFAGKTYPVMFWIHGGANTTGLKDYYDFTRLVASKEVVVVTTNYRLGALGWFTHPAIQDLQQGLDKTSNFGLLDIIEALKWVRTNISRFGGDAGNVTVFGESAGGHNIFALLASPLANGLFHKAIAQSGYTTSHSKKNAYNEGGENPLIERGAWQVVDGISANAENGYSLKQTRRLLKDMPARDFIGLYYQQVGLDDIPLTTIDGIVIPEPGLLGALGNRDFAKNIPVIAGATKDEVALWLGLHRYFMETSHPLTKLLPPVISIKNPELYDFWVRTRSHAWKLRGADVPLQALELAGYQQLYAYRFDWDHQEDSMFADFPSIIGAAHGTDVAFVTGQYRFGPISSYIYPDGPARSQMEETVMGAWSDFSRSGTPGDNLPVQWSRFTNENPAYIHLDRDDLLRMGVETETMETLLDSIATQQLPTDLEKCFIVWESLINVGDPDIDAHHDWNDGFCNQFDILAEQKNIAAGLIAEFGTIGID